MSKFERVCFETAGDGYWSNVSTEVDIEDINVTYCNEEKDHGELRVYFDTSDWKVSPDNLIYTDSLFMKQLRSFLTEQGLTGADVSYSEQGMQGMTDDENYVSCDIGKEFIDSWAKKFGQLTVDAIRGS